MRVVLFIIMFATASFSAQAITVQQYQSERNDQSGELVKHIVALAKGIVATDLLRNYMGHPPIMCLPQPFTLSAQEFFDLIDKEIHIRSEQQGILTISQENLEVLLLFGLMREFPCPKDN